MRLFTAMRRGAVGAVIATGLVLLASALQGVASIDTSLQVAASRAVPERTLVEETSDRGDCPYVAHRDGV